MILGTPYTMACLLDEDSDQPVYPLSLIHVFAALMKTYSDLDLQYNA